MHHQQDVHVTITFAEDDPPEAVADLRLFVEDATECLQELSDELYGDTIDAHRVSVLGANAEFAVLGLEDMTDDLLETVKREKKTPAA